MSDHDKFKDFLPEGFDIPPRAKMFDALSVLLKQYQERAISEMKALYPEGAKELDKIVASDGPPAGIMFDWGPSTRELNIFGADKIRFTSLWEPHGSSKYIVVGADLFDKEGDDYSPFGDESVLSGMVEIVISPDAEEPPFLLSQESVRNHPTDIAALKERMRQEGHGIIDLTDEECLAIMGVMTDLVVDADEMLSNIDGLDY